MLIPLSLLYPILIWWMWGRVDAWVLCILPIALLLVRFLGEKRALISRKAIVLVAIIWCMLSYVWRETAVLAYPLLVNGLFFCVFALSLMRGKTPIIERVARFQDKNFPDYAILYTRRVTQVWLIFFVINGLISAWTVFWGSLEAWALYNGLIAYILMGGLFTVEYIMRKLHKKKHETRLGT